MKKSLQSWLFGRISKNGLSIFCINYYLKTKNFFQKIKFNIFLRNFMQKSILFLLV